MFIPVCQKGIFMSNLSGKVAVITGGNSGIGFATAKEFSNQGAKVAISGRTDVDGAAKKLGSDVLGVSADVRSLGDLERLFTSVHEKLGKIDILFVNAGIVKMGGLADVTEADFDDLMNVNFKGAFFTIQKALPFLNDNASIILNGSINAHVGFAGVPIYSASKAAVHSLARTLAPELAARGIRINTLSIGLTETPLLSKVGLPQDALEGFKATVNNKNPMKRIGQPEEIAKAAAFLASSDSSFILGSEITTDGGMLLNAL
jgi:NAD(P)-dependent dehydrogenase (short-subunit alcohol dehydrogenase family)